MSLAAAPFAPPAPPLPGRRCPGLTPAEAGALLPAYRRGIFSYLRRRGFSAEEADDLTQETLIRAYRHLTGFRGVSMGAWIYRIAANVAVDHLRKQHLPTVPLETVPVLPAAADDPTAGLAREETGELVRSVVDGLPECHRRVLRLRYYEERSLSEIGGMMNCSPLAAKLRVFRAVTALRKRWRSLEAEGRILVD